MLPFAMTMIVEERPEESVAVDAGVEAVRPGDWWSHKETPFLANNQDIKVN